MKTRVSRCFVYAFVVSVIALLFAGCSSSNAALEQFEGIPVVVQVDGVYVPTDGYVWGHSPGKRDPSLLEREDLDIRIYDYSTDTWHFLKEGEALPRVVIDGKNDWWVAAEDYFYWSSSRLTARFFPAYEKKDVPVKMLPVTWCDNLEASCDITLRVRATPTPADELRVNLWDEAPNAWFEATVTVPGVANRDAISAYEREHYVLVSFSEGDAEVSYVDRLDNAVPVLFPAKNLGDTPK